MNFHHPEFRSEIEYQQRMCHHLYGPWQYVCEIANDRDLYKRVCEKCANELEHIGRMPPEGYKEELTKAVATSPDEIFKEKMRFLIQLASTMIRQK